MKKSIVCAVVGLVLTVTAFAQDKAIGLRFNGGYDNGAEISFQKSMGDANRLEADLGFGSNGGFALTGVYHWTWSLEEELAEGFAWYVGPGAGIRINNNGFGAGIVGQIGIEYVFPTVPIQLSIDSRPGIIFGAGGYNDLGGAFSVRYRF